MIEGEEDRSQRLKRSTTALALEAGAVGLCSSANHFHGAPSLSLLKSGFNGFDQSRPVILANDETIKDDVQWIVSVEKR
jgi:hypothetical protein